ncbi:MAG: YgfZ/GcvT domain-containing protein [Rhodospirillales bacterium]
MTTVRSILLEDRGVIGIDGVDAREFLQGLVSNDVRKVTVDRAVHAALLSPQGKYLHDFFIVAVEGGLLVDCEAGRLDDLRRRLAVYKLRAKVVLADRSDAFAVAAVFGDGALAALGLPADTPGAAVPFAGGVAYVDPRLAAIGARLLLPRDGAAAGLAATGFAAGDRAAYDTLRIGLGLADGSRDMEVERAILLENGFDELHGVDWDKGCYMGQELTARTRYRGLVRKRLVPVAVDGPLPPPGTPVLLDGKETGEVRSGVDGAALALIRLEALERAAASGAPLTAAGARLTPRKPDWAKF